MYWYIHIQLLSHLQMKSTTSCKISGNSHIILRSWSEVGTSSSLLSWPASTWMLFARLFIASRVSPWVFKCCKTISNAIDVEIRRWANFVYNLDTRKYDMCDRSQLLQVRQYTGMILNDQSPCWWRSLNQQTSQLHRLQKQNDAERNVTCSVLPPSSWSVDPRYSDQCRSSTIVFEEDVNITAMLIAYLDDQPQL